VWAAAARCLGGEVDLESTRYGWCRAGVGCGLRAGEPPNVAVEIPGVKLEELRRFVRNASPATVC